MADPLDAGELAAYFALRRAGDRLQRLVTRQLRAHELSEVQFSVLATLAAAPGGERMSDLADALIVSRSGLTYQVTQLQQRRLVERSGAEGDDRSVVARLTGAGQALVDAVLPEHVALVRASFLDLVAPDELRVLSEVLTRVAAGADGAEGSLRR